MTCKGGMLQVLMLLVSFVGGHGRDVMDTSKVHVQAAGMPSGRVPKGGMSGVYHSGHVVQEVHGHGDIITWAGKPPVSIALLPSLPLYLSPHHPSL